MDMVEPVYINRKVVTSGDTNIEYAPAKLTNITAAEARLIMSDLRPLFDCKGSYSCARAWALDNFSNSERAFCRLRSSYLGG